MIDGLDGLFRINRERYKLIWKTIGRRVMADLGRWYEEGNSKIT